MGKGRAPCCDKSKVKRGPWSPAEDLRLISFIHNHGHSNWRALPKLAGLLRCGKSCRLRWINYLRPDVKRGNFSPEEEQLIINLHNSFGNKWSKIASHLPGRTDNEIKNVWNTHLKKKRLIMMQNEKMINKESLSSFSGSYSSANSPSSPSSAASCISYGDLTFINSNKPNHDLEGDPPKQDHDTPAAHNNSDHSHEDQLQKPTEMINIIDIDDDIPLESADIVGEFWEILDNNYNVDDDIVIPMDQSNIVASSQQQQQQPPPPPEEEEDLGYKKWLKYLEDELGLIGGTNSHHDHHHHIDDQKDTENEMLRLAQQTTTPNDYDYDDGDMPYFPMWQHSSPLDFDF